MNIPIEELVSEQEVTVKRDTEDIVYVTINGTGPRPTLLYTFADFGFVPVWIEAEGGEIQLEFRRGDALERGRAMMEEHPDETYPL